MAAPSTVILALNFLVNVLAIANRIVLTHSVQLCILVADL